MNKGIQTNKNRSSAHTPPHRQRGMATILIILLISLSMTGAAFGIVHSLKASQNIHVATHAKTNAQASAWAGAEIFRKYLAVLAETPEALSNINGSIPISLENTNTTLVAEVMQVAIPNAAIADDPYTITVNIHSQDIASRSSAVVQVMYRVSLPSCDGPITLDSTLDFRGNLGIGGKVTIERKAQDTTSLYVEGDIDATSISLDGVSTFISTGNVRLGSAVYIPQIYANGNIVLEGGASVGKAFSGGQLTTAGDGSVTGEAYINGDINITGGTQGDLYSLGDIAISSSKNVGNINAAGTVDLAAIYTAKDIAAKGDIRMGSWNNGINNLITESDIECFDKYWPNYVSMKAGSTAINCSPTNVESHANVKVTNMTRLTDFTKEPAPVDAWALQSQANYQFEWDGAIKVTVNNVNSIEDGVYYIGEHVSTEESDFLCKQVHKGKCQIYNPVGKMCNGYSDSDACFSYDESTSTLKIEGKNLAPGVVWVEGNLSLSNGEYYNTFIVTGNITTSEQHKTQAINYAGYDTICNNLYPNDIAPHFEYLFPTNLCDSIENNLVENAIGNIALLAGGYDPEETTTYLGGDIDLGNSTEISGSVLAGNIINTTGSVLIKGYVSGSNFKNTGQSNSLGSSTIIDLSDLPATLQPSKIPKMGTSSACEIDDNDVSQTFWSKYI